MSLDPASYSVELASTTRTLVHLHVQADGVYAFDFDGVVSSSTEDDIYHLETWEGEAALLENAARKFKVRCEAMELKYQRHLLYQACALHLDIDIEPGPAFSHIKEAAQCSRVFVLTARSGWYAVERMRRFLLNHGIIPIDVFNVGRVRKDRQVALLCSEFPRDKVFYIEDNPAHLSAVSALQNSNLELILADRETPKLPREDLITLFTKTITNALSDN